MCLQIPILIRLETGAKKNHKINTEKIRNMGQIKQQSLKKGIYVTSQLKNLNTN